MEKIETKTLSLVIVNRLRSLIVNADLKAGEPLSQDKLAEEFGVSRLPVREALAQLNKEGLVYLQTFKRASVAEISPQGLEEYFAIGEELETLAHVRGTARLTDGDIEEMENILAEMRNTENDPKRWFQLNMHFHMVVVKAANWSHLTQLIEETRTNITRYFNNILAVSDQGETYSDNLNYWDDEHHNILEACRTKDTAMIEKLMRVHWAGTKKAWNGYFAATGNIEAVADVQGLVSPKENFNE